MKQCTEFVDTYEPAIVAFLVNEIEPSQVCPMLHLCDEQNTVHNLQSNGLISLKSDSSCEMCEFAMNEVFSVLKDKDDQDMVKNVLKSICYRLPNSIESSCEDFVEKYTSGIINFIVAGLTPDEVCAALDLCSSTVSAPAPIEKECDNFVETYTDIIIDMLTKDVTPEMICTNLGLCKPKGNVVVHQVIMEQTKDP